MIYLLFIFGFFLVIKGADILVSGASAIAKTLNMSDLVIGLTVVSFGTSLPELTVSALSGFQGHADLAIGNILGSNIANILLVLGVSAIICPLPIGRNTIMSEIPFSLLAVLLVGFLANASLFMDHHTLSISRIDGGILLLFFVLFMAYVFKISEEDAALYEETVPKHVSSRLRAIAFIIFGSIGLFLGGQWVVNGALRLTTLLGFSESFIGLTVVALGTSLPELATSAIAAYRKNTDIAVGNAIGSNIFNIVWILGISAMINSLPFDVINNTDILMNIFSGTLLIFAVAVGKTSAIERWKGIVFIATYTAYIIYLVHRG